MSKKYILLYVIYISIVTFITYTFIYSEKINHIKQNYRNQLFQIVEVSSLIINPDDLQVLVYGENIEYSYNEINSKLSRIKSIYSDMITYLYIYIPFEKGIVKFINDADEDVAFYGDEYDASLFPVMLQALDTNTSLVEHNIVYDKEFDIWVLSAFAPLYNKDGKQIATLGLDSSANNYFTVAQQEIIIIFSFSLVIVLLSLALPLSIIYLYKKIKMQM